MKSCFNTLSFISALMISTSCFAAETIRYDCGDEQIRIGYSEDYALLDYQGKLFLLKSAISASGTRYAGEGWQWWSKDVQKDGALAVKLENEDFASDKGHICTVITR